MNISVHGLSGAHFETERRAESREAANVLFAALLQELEKGTANKAEAIAREPTERVALPPARASSVGRPASSATGENEQGGISSLRTELEEAGTIGQMLQTAGSQLCAKKLSTVVGNQRSSRAIGANGDGSTGLAATTPPVLTFGREAVAFARTGDPGRLGEAANHAQSHVERVLAGLRGVFDNTDGSKVDVTVARSTERGQVIVGLKIALADQDLLLELERLVNAELSRQGVAGYRLVINGIAVPGGEQPSGVAHGD